MIVLLDLNFTLAENSPVVWERTGESFPERIKKETYRAWLIDLIRPHYVILMTARMERYRVGTLANIAAKTGGWQPAEAYFNAGDLTPEKAKLGFLLDHVYPKHGQGGLFGAEQFIALESNKTTRAMYTKQGILAMPIEDERCRMMLATK